MKDAATHSTGLPGYLRRSGYLHGMLILVALVSGVMAWAWLMQVTVETVQVRGTLNSEPGEITALADVGAGDVLYDIEPSAVVERIAAHPWVEAARITRWPTGTMNITVRERTPVVMTIGSDGRPEFYLDAAGYQMMPTDAATYDVPLLFGYPENVHPATPTGNETIASFLEALDAEADEAGPLLSEVIYRQDEVWLQLEPTGLHASTPVRLGQGDFDNKLKRLSAFWNQRMISRQNRTFDLIDLRFSSQIITREHERK